MFVVQSLVFPIVETSSSSLVQPLAFSTWRKYYSANVLLFAKYHDVNIRKQRHIKHQWASDEGIRITVNVSGDMSLSADWELPDFFAWIGVDSKKLK